MATVSLWHIGGKLRDLIAYVENPDKTILKNELQELVNVFSYDTNSSKTNEQQFVTAINCKKEIALQQMIITKQQFDKTDGYIAWHGYQSFKPGEITPEQCHEIGVKFAKEVWGNRFQIIVSTHLDKDHLHNHFCFNSVSFLDGNKYNYSKAEQNRLRAVSDALCKEYGLSVIESSGKAPNRSLYYAEKNNEPTKYNLMRQAIDEAISISYRVPDFIYIMKEKGYIIDLNPNKKYATIRSINEVRNTRLVRLGEQYDRVDIIDRIKENSPALTYSKTRHFIEESRPRYIKPKQYSFRGNLKSTRKITELRALYFYYCYLLGYLPKKKPHTPLTPEMREANRWLERYSKEIDLMCREKLNTLDDVNEFISTTNEQITHIENARKKIYNKLRRCDDTDEIAKLHSKRDEYTSALNLMRKEVHTAEDILEDNDKINENIKAERSAQNQKFVTKTRQQSRYRNYER